jgi:hypothetical protein
MPIEDFIIFVFCWVDDNLKNILKQKSLRQRGFLPKLTDSEVITMEIVAEFLGIDTDKGIWEYFQQHWLHLFPNLGSRPNFVRQAANLWLVKKRLQQRLAASLGGMNDILHMADGFPMPVCHFKRAHFSKNFRGDAGYGYCASKSEKYYGFKGNLLINSEGVITDITLTAANVDERESLWDLVDNIQGLVLADKGLIGHSLQRYLFEEKSVNLQTPMRDNMTDTRGKDAGKWLVSTRRLVETVIGQLTERFHIEKVRTRDLWHLTNRIIRKTLSHTIAVLANKLLGNPSLRLELVVQA